LNTFKWQQKIFRKNLPIFQKYFSFFHLRKRLKKNQFCGTKYQLKIKAWRILFQKHFFTKSSFLSSSKLSIVKGKLGSWVYSLINHLQLFEQKFKVRPKAQWIRNTNQRSISPTYYECRWTMIESVLSQALSNFLFVFNFRIGIFLLILSKRIAM
jgi:hypothetical protein